MLLVRFQTLEKTRQLRVKSVASMDEETSHFEFFYLGCLFVKVFSNNDQLDTTDGGLN